MKFIYTECWFITQAEKIATALVRQKLAACVNWWPVESLYQWKSKMHRHREVALLCKTTDGLVDKARRYLLRIHPYKQPVIAVWPAAKINTSAVNWLRQELR